VCVCDNDSLLLDDKEYVITRNKDKLNLVIITKVGKIAGQRGREQQGRRGIMKRREWWNESRQGRAGQNKDTQC
jgi:hypothetical protein